MSCFLKRISRTLRLLKSHAGQSCRNQIFTSTLDQNVIPFGRLCRPAVSAVRVLELVLAKIPGRRARIETLFTTMWGDIPNADNNLAANLVQGLALSGPSDNYSRDLLRFLEDRLSCLLADCLPKERCHILKNDDAFAHLAFMAFDGFILGRRLKRPSKRLPEVVFLTADLLMGTAKRLIYATKRVLKTSDRY